MLRRRELLRVALVGAAAVPLGGCVSDETVAPPAPARQVFLHGLASGDPLADAVILWTRVTTPDGAPVEVRWELARDPGFAELVGSGSLETSADRDHRVKLDAGGLEASSTYYYRFVALGELSPIGRTRTAPAGDAARLRLGVASCSSYAHGHFNAYRRLAARSDLDVVLHLGDYIYEYGDGEYGELRGYDPPHEIVTLEDYRRRYAHYRRDGDLQEAHRQHAFVTVWDDHETANNSWAGGAENHDPSEGSWEQRKAAALQAYLEWMPVREQPDGRLWRALPLGGLCDLLVLDTRIWGRDEQAAGMDDPLLDDPERSLLGADQEAWLAEQLETSTAQWKLLAQQVLMGQLPAFVNADAWDGYPSARERLLDVIATQNVDDVVVLTGDIHSSWAMDLTPDPFDPAYDSATGSGSLAVEVVTPGVTSPGFPDSLAHLADGLLADNPHMKHVDLSQNGYIVLDITPERLQAAWYYVATIQSRSDAEALGAVVACYAASRHLVVESEAAPPATEAPPAAP